MLTLFTSRCVITQLASTRVQNIFTLYAGAAISYTNVEATPLDVQKKHSYYIMI